MAQHQVVADRVTAQIKVTVFGTQLFAAISFILYHETAVF